MTVTAEHWLSGVRKEIVGGPSKEMPVRRALVIHFTSGATAISSVNYWRELGGGVCAHVIIDRDGTIIQCRPFNRTAGHAGVSRWRDPKTHKLYTGLNSCSIGIELANGGDNAALIKRWSALPPYKARHRNGGPICAWEAYPDEQWKSCVEVSETLVKRYNLDDVTGHDCIAPERKNDPGPAFDIQSLRESCGFSGLPVVHWSK